GTDCWTVSGLTIRFISTLEICRARLTRTREEVYRAVSDWFGRALLWRWGRLLSRPSLYHAFPPPFFQRGHQSPTLPRVLCDVLCALDDRLWSGVSVAHGGDLPYATGGGIIPPSRPIFSPCGGVDFCICRGIDPHD